jgi:hypothetical protein
MANGTREYGEARLRRVLRDPAHPLFADAERSRFGIVIRGPDLEPIEPKESAPLKLGGAGSIGDAFRAHIPDINDRLPSLTVEDVAVPTASEPVLILVVRWRLANGSFREECLSERDRLFGNRQAFGCIKELGDFRRGVSADNTMQRTTCIVLLSNVDGRFDRCLMDKEWVGATVSVRLGFAHLKPSEFSNPVDFFIDRFEELKPGVVTMGLIDAIDDPLETNKLIKPPRIENLYKVKWSGSKEYERQFTNVPDWADGWGYKGFADLVGVSTIDPKITDKETRGFYDEEVLNTLIPMPLGEDAFYRSPFTWVRHPIGAPGDGQYVNPVLVSVLGCSKNLKAFGEDDHAWSPGKDPILYARKGEWPKGTNKEVPVFVPFYEPGNADSLFPSGFLPQYGAHARVRTVTVEDLDWSRENPDKPKQFWRIAYLFVVLDSYIFDVRESTPSWYREQLLRSLAHLQNETYVRSPEGAQGRNGNLPISGMPTEFNATPAGIIEYLLRYFNGAGVPPITASMLRDLHESPSNRSAVVGAVIDKDTATVDAINGICRAHQIHLVYAPQRGGYMFVTDSPSPNDLAAIKSADDFDETSMVEDSFSLSTPVGDELHGFANRFKIKGLREPFDVLADLGEDNYYVSQDGLSKMCWRVYDRELDLEYLAHFSISTRGGLFSRLQAIVARHTKQENVVTFATSLRGLGYEVGDFVNVSHGRAGAPTNPDGSPSRGWHRRLCRIDAITYSWRQKKITFELVDRDEWSTRRTYYLDDERRWVFKRAPVNTAVTLTPGSSLVFCNNWVPSDVQPGMLLSYTSKEQPFLNRHFRIKDVDDQWLVLAEEVPYKDDEDNPILIEASEEFKILYGHLRPPPNSRYDQATLDSDAYGRLCDEGEHWLTGEVGHYSDGTGGHKLAG